jgi:hypothetical protein
LKKEMGGRNMGTSIEEQFSNFTAIGNEPEAALTEPSLITCEFVTGCAVDADEHVLTFTGWIFTPHTEGNMPERRIIVRFAMPISAARALRSELNKKLAAGH